MDDKDMLGKTRKRNRIVSQNTNIDGIRNDTNEPIPQTVKTVKARLNEVFSECSDFVHREIVCGEGRQIKMLVAYINGFVDTRALNQDVFRPILDYFSNAILHDKRNPIYGQLKECVVNNNDIKDAEKNAAGSGTLSLRIQSVKLSILAAISIQLVLLQADWLEHIMAIMLFLIDLYQTTSTF